MNPLLAMFLSAIISKGIDFGANKLLETSPDQPTAMSDPEAERKKRLAQMMIQFEGQQQQQAPQMDILRQIMMSLQQPSQSGF